MINGFPERIVRMVARQIGETYENTAVLVAVGDPEFVKKCKAAQKQMKAAAANRAIQKETSCMKHSEN